MSLVDDLATSINNKKINTTLRIGTGIAFGKMYLSKIIKDFKQLHPNCIFHITIDSSEILEPLLTNGNIDLCIMEGTSHIPDFQHQEVYHSPIVAVCHKEHHLARKSNITAEMLIKENLLLREKLCPTREMVNAYFSNHNLSMTCYFESSSALALINAVKENLGIAILPLDHFEYFYTSDLKQIDVPDFQYTRYIDFIYRKKTILSPLAQAFMQFTSSYIQHSSILANKISGTSKVT